jgi:hypothetical protein
MNVRRFDCCWGTQKRMQVSIHTREFNVDIRCNESVARGDASSLHESTFILVHDDKACNESITLERGEAPTSARPCLSDCILKLVQAATR